MTKVTIKISRDEILALDAWIEDLVMNELFTDTWADKCCLAVLREWQLAKLKPKTYMIELRSFTTALPATVSLALAHMITLSNEPVTSYLGNRLHQLYTILYKVYEPKKLTTQRYL